MKAIHLKSTSGCYLFHVIYSRVAKIRHEALFDVLLPSCVCVMCGLLVGVQTNHLAYSVQWTNH